MSKIDKLVSNYLGEKYEINLKEMIKEELENNLSNEKQQVGQEMNLNNSGYFKQQTGVLTVNVGDVTLVQQPTNLLNPISMLEGDPGTDPDNFQDMIKVSFLPYLDQVPK